ncbi:MAG: TatD family hydrolase [Patescibacteria group bacterium]|nr:TatD family hydrolase [Patescibacteria group bacterium]
MLIDTHAHLNFKAYKDDLLAVIERCRQEPMKVINVGAAYDTSRKAVNLALAESSFYAAIGLHPIHVYDEEFKAEDYQDLIYSAKENIVAIGETGFDYWHLQESLAKGAQSIEEIKKKQEKVFRQHIKLAKANNLPLIIHGRNGKNDPQAYQGIYSVLKEEGVDRGVVHCFGGSLEEAKQFVDLGFYLGFTGIITFDPSSRKISGGQHPKPLAKDVSSHNILWDIAKWIPENRFLIETDAPYLTPEPYRSKRNEPIYVKYVAEKIAQIRGSSVDEIISISSQNAINLFGLK